MHPLGIQLPIVSDVGLDPMPRLMTLLIDLALEAISGKLPDHYVEDQS